MVGVRDYSPTAASNLSVGGISIAEGWARASVNNAYRAGMADIANLLLDQGGSTLTTGTGDTYLLDLPSAPTAYADNMAFVCTLHAPIASGAVTININGLGVKDFKRVVNGEVVPLSPGDGPAGHRASCIYSSAANAVLMMTTFAGPSNYFYDTISAGGTPDAADNTAAFLDIQSQILAADAAGDPPGAMVLIPPGLWNFQMDPNDTGVPDPATGLPYGRHTQWDMNVKKMKVLGYGATLRNVWGENPAAPIPEGTGSAGPIYPYTGVFLNWTVDYDKYLIDTAAIGATSITLKTPGHTGSGIITTPSAVGGDFRVGEMVMVGSGDCQFNGGPPNLQYHDYVTITGLNCSGTLLDPLDLVSVPDSIMFEPPLSNRHLETYPEYDESIVGGSSAVGKARVWKLSRPRIGTPEGGGHGDIGSEFDVERTYEGFACGSGGNMPMGGKRIDCINLTAPGMSPTMYGWFNIKGCKFDGGPLVPNPSFPGSSGIQYIPMSNQVAADKLGGYLNFEDCDVKQGLTAGTSTCEFLRAVRTTFHYNVQAGAKYTYLQHCKLPSLSMQTYGLADVVIDQCKIAAANSPDIRIFGQSLPVANYANGRITLPKGTPPPFLGSAVPMIGTAIWPTLAGATTDISGLWGVVTNVWDDATNFYYDVAGLPDALPAAFVSGSSTIRFAVQKLRSIRVRNSHGCYEIERLSQNPSPLQQTKLRILFSGNPYNGGTLLSKTWIFGQLKSVKINVIKPITGTTAPTAPVSLGSLVPPLGPSGSPPTGATWARFSMSSRDAAYSNMGFSIWINMNVAGERELTKTGITGFQVGDRFVDSGGTHQTDLTNKFTQGPLSYALVTAAGASWDYSALPANQFPVIEITGETDEEAWNYRSHFNGASDLAIY